MNFIELDKYKQTQSGVPSFLLANSSWIQTYYEYKRRSGYCLGNGCEDSRKTPGVDIQMYKEECYRSAFDDYKCTFGIGVTDGDNPIYKELGHKGWNKTERGIYLRKSIKVMEREEYDTFFEDPVEFMHSICLKRLYTSNVDYTVLKENLGKFNKLVLNENRIFDNLTQSGRIFLNLMIISSPLDFLADYLRGTKELLMDIHSVPDLVKHACQVITGLGLHQADVYRKYYNRKQLILPLHLPGLLSRRDFEEFYYPAYNTLVQELIQKGFEILILFEGNVDRFIDIISQLDSNQVIAHFESTDIEEYQEYFQGKGTFISGFYPSHMLKYGSEKECLQEARKLRNKVEGNDRYIFSTNRVLFTGNDVNYDYLLKVYEYFSY